MIALLRLRKKEPGLKRPFKVPMYPVFTIVALIIAVISFIAMVIYNRELAAIYFLILGISYIAFKLFAVKNINN
jgi:ethanolamine permease